MKIWNPNNESWTDDYQLTSGRIVYAEGLVIGLGPNINGGVDHASVDYGADGTLWMDDWTSEERIELADYMIALWTKWKEEQKKGQT